MSEAGRGVAQIIMRALWRRKPYEPARHCRNALVVAQASGSAESAALVGAAQAALLY